MQHDAAHQLHVIVAHAHDPAGGFADQGEDFGQKVVQGAFTGLHLLAVFRHAPGEILVGQFLHLGFERVDARHDGAQAAQVAVVLAAENLFENETEHAFSSFGGMACPGAGARPRASRKKPDWPCVKGPGTGGRASQTVAHAVEVRSKHGFGNAPGEENALTGGGKRRRCPCRKHGMAVQNAARAFPGGRSTSRAGRACRAAGALLYGTRRGEEEGEGAPRGTGHSRRRG